MTKFHINDKGEPGKCSATKGNCPFGGPEKHFNTFQEAAIAFESSQETFPKPTSIRIYDQWTGSSKKYQPVIKTDEYAILYFPKRETPFNVIVAYPDDQENPEMWSISEDSKIPTSVDFDPDIKEISDVYSGEVFSAKTLYDINKDSKLVEVIDQEEVNKSFVCLVVRNEPEDDEPEWTLLGDF